MIYIFPSTSTSLATKALHALLVSMHVVNMYIVCRMLRNHIHYKSLLVAASAAPANTGGKGMVAQ